MTLRKKAQEIPFQEEQFKLHNIASNRATVMKSSHPADLASDLNMLNIGKEDLPLQYSLGIVWDLNCIYF